MKKRWRSWLGAMGLLLALSCGVLPTRLWAQSAAEQPPSPLTLTADEKAYVAAHPVVRAGFVDMVVGPLQTWGSQRQLEGMVADYLALIAQRTGLRFEPSIATSIAQRDEALVSRRVDVLPLILLGDAVESQARMTTPYFRARAVFVTRRDTTDFTASGSLGGLRVATIEGSAFDRYLRRRFPNARFVASATPESTLSDVASGQADVTVGLLPVTVHTIESQLLANLSVRAFAADAPESFAMAVQSQLPQLHTILNKALASISADEHEAILVKWVPVRHLLEFDATTLLLNDAERAWLKAHPRVRVAYDRSFAPYTMEHNRQMQGMGADLLRAVAARVGLDIVEERPGTWTEALKAAREGDVDMLVAAGRNEERREHFNFVGPWNASPTAIVTRAGRSGPLELGDLFGSPLALQEDHFLVPVVQRKHPALQLLTFRTLEEALASVREGRAGAALGNMNVVSDLIQRDNPGALTINGVVKDGDSELFMAVNARLPELAVILRKGLDSMSEAERTRLRQKWLAARYQPGWTLRQVLLVLLPALLTAGAVVWVVRRANRRLMSEVAQRQHAERALAHALGREQRVSQSKSAFIASLGHEIRNPMSAMVSAAGLLAQRVDLSAESRHWVHGIQTAGDGLLELLSRALDFSKAEVGTLSISRTWVDPRAWCVGLCSAYSALASGKGLALEPEVVVAPDVQLEIDPVRLGQVLGNLISNAIKFNAHGRVHVEVRLDTAASMLRLVVEDEGPGIPADEQARLFEPYTQLPSTHQRHGEGLGLGLALCREIMRQMGGSIRLDGRPGPGARFVAELPAAWRVRPDGDEPTPALHAAVAPCELNGEEVMLVDDDPVVREVTAAQLRSLGLSVIALDSGEAALERWARQPVRLLLTDCHMPGIDGFELTRQLRQRDDTHQPWIIALTGSEEPEEHARCRASGMDDVMVKPIRPQELMHRLRQTAVAPHDQPTAD